MEIGIRFFVLGSGAAIAIVVNASVAGIDIHVLGWILMATGAIGLIAATAVLAPRRWRKNMAAVRTPSVTELGHAPGPSS